MIDSEKLILQIEKQIQQVKEDPNNTRIQKIWKVRGLEEAIRIIQDQPK